MVDPRTLDRGAVCAITAAGHTLHNHQFGALDSGPLVPLRRR
jgi:hypothetical protein